MILTGTNIQLKEVFASRDEPVRPHDFDVEGGWLTMAREVRLDSNKCGCKSYIVRVDLDKPESWNIWRVT